MSEVLLTGGAGFIGCGLASELIARGDRVVVVDSLHPQVHPERRRPDALPAAAELLVADVTEPATWTDALDVIRPDALVHLAAETGTGQSFSEASRHGLVNVVGLTRGLDALLASGAPPQHLVVPSSRAVYGEGSWRAADGHVFYPPARAKEMLEAGQWDPTAPDGSRPTPLASVAGTTVPAPTSVYGATKLAQEHIASAWVAGTSTALSVLRFQNVYGPGQSLTNSYTGIVALFARLARAHEEIDVYEDGEIVRDFVFIDDVVSAVVAAIDRPPDRPRCLDIGSGLHTTINEVATIIADRNGAPHPHVSGRWRVGDIRAASCDPDPAAEAIDYRARWSLTDGLDALLDWMPPG